MTLILRFIKFCRRWYRLNEARKHSTYRTYYAKGY